MYYVFEGLIPLPFGHSPYLIYDEQRERKPESVISTAGIF